MRFTHRILMVSIGLLFLNMGGEAQSTYAFIYLKDEGKFNMVKGDFLSGEYEVMFSLDTSRFYEHDAYRYSENSPGIDAFEFSADSSKLYFVEIFGDFYVYDIPSDNMTYIKDLSPQPSSSSEPYFVFDVYHQINDLKLLNDTLLYVAGAQYGKLNLNTYNYESIREIESYSASFTDYEQQLMWYSSVIDLKDTFNLSLRGKLMNPKLDTPDSSSLICDYGQFFPQNQIFAGYLFKYQFDCDSTSWYIFDKYGEDFNLYEIDIPGCTIFLASTSQEFDGYISDDIDIADMKHYNNHNVENCELYIDLDEDDSTIEGIDFDGEEVCRHTILPVSDEDVELRNTYPFDSIRIEIENKEADQYITIESGNFSLLNNNSPEVLIHNNGSTQLSDYQQAIETALYMDDASYRPGTVQIKVTGWYNGDSSETAVATYEVISRPDAGADMDLEYCQADETLYLYDELEVSDEGAFYSSAGDMASGSVILSDPLDTNFMYIIDNGLCADTAVWNIAIYPKPDVENIQDQRLCPGNSYTADLSDLAGTVEWFDGDSNTSRTFDEEGSYFYKHTNEAGCTSVDSFQIEFLNQAIQETIDTTLCYGETFEYKGMTYSSPAVIKDSVQSIAGCDSVIMTLDISFQSQRELVEEDTLGYCAGNVLDIPLDADVTAETLNGSPVSLPIRIENEGSYTLAAIDEFGCRYRDTFQVRQWPAPNVITQDIIDEFYQAGMQLPITYSGTITNYRWTPQMGLSCYDCAYPELMSPEQGFYNIEVVNAYGCKDSATINLVFSTPDIYVPNIVSANSGITENEVFYMRSESDISYSMQIYNRWGDIVYEVPNAVSNDISSGWRPLNRDYKGVFVYRISFKSDDGQTQTLVGSLTVVY